MFLRKAFYGKLALIGILSCLGILSYCAYLSVKNVNLQEKLTAHSIGVIDSISLKQRAKCFSVHEETSKMLSDVFKQVRNSEGRTKDRYEKMISNKKLDRKKKQREITRIENDWKRTSASFEQKVLNIRLLDNKLSEKINKTLEDVLHEISTELKLILIVNKGSERMINVFYNIPSLDVTDRVVQLMDKKLADFSINSVSIS